MQEAERHYWDGSVGQQSVSQQTAALGFIVPNLGGLVMSHRRGTLTRRTPRPWHGQD
jgi:hypothetical protein